MQTFPFRNPANQSWEEDADTVIFGDELLEEVHPPDDDDYDTVPLGLGPFKQPAPYVDEASWQEDSVDEYLSEDVLEEAEPSAPSFSRPTFEGPILAGSAFAHPAASVPAHLQHPADLQYGAGANPLRRSSMPPAPLPPLPSRYAAPPMRAEMPTPVMEIMPTLDAIRPESRPLPPPAHQMAHAVHIPPASPIPRGLSATAPRQTAPAYQASYAAQRANSHLDTLRPYAATSRPAVPPAQEDSWVATLRPLITKAEGHLQDFWDYSSDALRDLLGWVEDAWDTAWEQTGASRVESAKTGSARSLAHPAAPSLWQSTSAATKKYVNLRTVTWTLGAGLTAMLLVALSAPSPAPVGAAQPGQVVVDADALTPAAVRKQSATESTAPAAQAAQKEKEEAADQKQLIERALAGDRVAVAALSDREPTSLSLEEVQALAVGEEKIAREKTTQTVLKIAQKRRLTSDDVSKFLRHVGNPRTYREALLAMAENRSWQGPDLIYLAMRRYRSQPHVADFALSLLLTPRIYKYASPALTVVIDAESMAAEPTSSSECFHVRQLVDRAYEDGDSRAVQHMARFASTTGCGENDTEDCYPCLRDDSALVDALRAAKTRQPPF